MKIVVLEDNHERQTLMRSCLVDRFHQYEAVFFDNTPEMLAFLEHNLSSVLLVSLDHDLELKPQANGKSHDPGNGREIADFLARQTPSFPIIIHTTNSAAGDGMEFLLREHRWKVKRVHPYGNMEWISEVWFRAARNAIVEAAQLRVEAKT